MVPVLVHGGSRHVSTQVVADNVSVSLPAAEPARLGPNHLCVVTNGACACPGPKLINITVLGVRRNTISVHVLYLAVPGPHCAVHAAVPRRCVLPAVRSVQEPPVPVVAEVALVRPPLRDLLHLLVPHHLHHVRCLRLARLLSLGNPPPQIVVGPHQLRSFLLTECLFYSTLFSWPRVYAHGVLWHELTVVHVRILSSLVLTLAVRNGTVVPALEADVVRVLGARHVAPRPAVSLVRVSAVVVGRGATCRAPRTPT